MDGSFGFPPEWVDEVRRASDIVAVVSQHVALRRSGRGFVGLCPFHQEKTPSFHVHPERQFFHCFGCGVGGDVIRFVRMIHGWSFGEAIRWLADRAGIPLPAGSAAEERRRRERQALLEVQRWVADFYARVLWSREGEAARAYLAGRKVGPEAAKRFGLGFAPEAPEVLPAAAERSGIPLEMLAACGVVVRREQPGGSVRWYDRFAGRIVFPIRNSAGEVIAFGGRLIDQGQRQGHGEGPGHGPGRGQDAWVPAPKYLNSPDTVLYRKGRELYGLDVARESIRRLGEVVVVEGYMDCIALVQAGVENVVASLGTALTTDQVFLLGRFARTVTVAYDADTAGQAATERGLELLERAGLTVRVADWPPGEDPDDVARRDPDEARRRLQQALPVWDYRFRRLIGERIPADTESRRLAIRRVSAALARVREAAEREVLIQQAASRLGISPLSLADQVEGMIRHLRRHQGKERRRPALEGQHTNDGPPEDRPNPAAREAAFLAWFFRHPREGKALVGHLQPEWFSTPGYRRLVAALRDSEGDVTGILRGVAGEEIAAWAEAFAASGSQTGAAGATWPAVRAAPGQAASEVAAALERGPGPKAETPEAALRRTDLPAARYGREKEMMGADVYEQGLELLWRLEAEAEIRVIASVEQELGEWERMLHSRLPGLNRLVLRYKEMMAALAPFTMKGGLLHDGQKGGREGEQAGVGRDRECAGADP